MCGNCEYERYNFFMETINKIDAVELKKQLYKNKTLATFEYYEDNKLWYSITSTYGILVIPIPISDIGSTTFHMSIKASELNRWIEDSVNKNTYRKNSI